MKPICCAQGMMALNSKPKIQLLPWDACSVWSPPQLWGGGKQRQKEKQSTTSMSPNAVSAWDITDYPSFCLSGVVPLQPPKQIIDFNPINFLDLLIFLHIYCQPLFDFNKDLLTKYNKFHVHISGNAVMENMSLYIFFLDIQEKMFIFSISFPLHIFKQNRKAISNCYFFKCLLNYEFTWPFLQWISLAYMWELLITAERVIKSGN